jgi:hypothetical protein
MNDLSPNYRTDGGYVLIEMELDSLLQFFNTFDPSPFYKKDIDDDAEEYIVSAAREINVRDPIKLVIHLPPEEAAREDSGDIQEAIHNYFAYRTSAAQRELRLEFQQGRLSLIIGLAFLTACSVLRYLLSLFESNTVLAEIVGEGLLISGWVAMWRPFQIFLYDWWPIRKKIKVMRKLTQMEVEIHPNLKTSSSCSLPK